MKKMMRPKKKNQIMIALLAVLIAAAGYINYSGFEFETKEAVSTETKESTKSAAANDESTPVGEAVLTSGEVADYVAQAKLTREQTHEKSKETLQAVISNKDLGEAEKQDATKKLAVLSENLEKEVAAEELLGVKGFLNSVVSIGEQTTDVMIQKKDISAIERAQIEDIITRKTGCGVENIVITTMETDD